jgi:hypothetical protein
VKKFKKIISIFDFFTTVYRPRIRVGQEPEPEPRHIFDVGASPT